MRRGAAYGRRDLLKGALAAGGLAAGPGRALAAGVAAPALTPLRLRPEEITDVKCCLRPFRAGGPNLDAEQVGGTLVVHNYGHGGSGWSLSWGSAEVAVGKALSVLPKEIAVIGCGVVGLTAAVHAQRAGLKVTIYAREPYARTRSVRAGGLWTPDSRIALGAVAGPGFGPLWSRWRAPPGSRSVPTSACPASRSPSATSTPFPTRLSRPASRRGPTPPGRPSPPPAPRSRRPSSPTIPSASPTSSPSRATSPPGENPFGTPHGRVVSQMLFNFGAYGHLLMQQFLEAGGRFEIRDFHTPADVALLRQKVVINSTGFAAKALWNDKTMVPVRGQTGWLPPQPGARYGVRYRNGLATSKSDGVLVMNFPRLELGDMYGVGDGNEAPDRADIVEGIAAIAPLFAGRGARA